MRKRYYVGLVNGSIRREVFRSATEPSESVHGGSYAAVIGPFRTKRGAKFCAEHGYNNPHCQSVSDAELLGILAEWARGRDSESLQTGRQGR